MKSKRLSAATRELMIATAKNAATDMYPGFFVYRGGHYITVHRQFGKAYRLIFAPDCAQLIRHDKVYGWS